MPSPAGPCELFQSPYWSRRIWPGQTTVVKREYVDGPFGKIHLRLARPSDLERDTQPPLALFHYSPGSSRMYANLIPLSAADRLVMALDTPGYGNSSAPPEQPSITDYSEALADAAEQLTDGQPIDIFGHLTGSLIAVEMAIARPDLIHRVVLSRFPVFSDEFSTRSISMFQQFHAQQQADSTGQYLIESLETSLANRDPSESPERAIGIYIDSLLPGRNWSYGETPPFSYRADVQMPRICQPTLYLNWTWDYAGAWSPFGGKETCVGGANIILNTTLQTLGGLGVSAWQKQLDVITKHILEFLNQP